MEFKKLKLLTINIILFLFLSFNSLVLTAAEQQSIPEQLDQQQSLFQRLNLFGTFTTTIYNTNSKAIVENPGTKISNHLIFNASYTINDNIDVVGSLSIKNTTYNQDYFPILDYLSANYTNYYPRLSLQTNIRIGRVKMSDLLLSDERNNPNSRWSITLPFSVHWPAFAHFEQAVDGAQFEFTYHSSNYGNITFSTTLGHVDIPDHDKRYVAYGYLRHLATNNNIENNDLIQSYVLKYQKNKFTIKASKTKYPLNHNVDWQKYLFIPPQTYDITQQNQHDEPVFHFVHDYEALGGRFHDKEHRYCVSAEYVRHLNFPSKPYTYFVQGCKMLTTNLGVGIEYSGLSYKNKHLMPTGIPSWSKNGNSYKLTAFYNIDSKQKIKFEYVQGNGTVWFPFPGTEPNWYLFSTSYTYKF